MRDIKNALLLFGLFFTIYSVGYTQIPTGYYNDATGLSGESLRVALETIIDDHSAQTYTSLWTHMQTTDVKANGKVWDMYSDIPGGTPSYEYTFVTNQCGNYSTEGDCYNREHSFPKSWFGDILPMNTDLFHLYPTDGYTNGKRSNYPFGEVGTATWTSTNGSKLGTSSYTGYSGTVFEPIDEYKGDFARSYFYMLTRYNDLISGWSSDMLSGSDFTNWAKNMLIEWHENDTVSTKETERNNDVYGIQNNRNPFIDHPEYVDYIWGGGAPGNVAPEITEIAIDPTSPTESDVVSVSAKITDSDGSISSVKVLWGTDGSTFPNEISMSVSSGDIYDSDSYIDAQAAETTVYYKIEATDNNTATTTSNTNNYTITASGGGGVENHWTESFDDQTTNTYVTEFTCASSGTWNALQAGNFSLGTPRTGSKCVAINDDKAGAHITTPSLNTVGTVSFYYYQRNGSASDEFQLQLSVDGGGFINMGDPTPYNVGEIYTLFSYDLNAASSDVKIRVLNDNQSAHLIIDDFTVNSFDTIINPPISNDINGCVGGEIPELYAEGTNIKWYSDSELANHIYSGNTFNTGHTSIGVYTYFVTQTISIYESMADTVTLTINEIPITPVIEDKSVCFGNTNPEFYAEGENINWYEDAELTVLLETSNVFIPTETEAGTYTYYATKTINDCESDAEIVGLVIYSLPEPPIGIDAGACSNDDYFEVYAEGENLSWYADSDLTELIDTGNTYITTYLDVGVHYFYVVQFMDECFSLPDTVTLTVYELPDEPISEDVNVCFGTEPIYLIAAGNNIEWYEQSTLDNVIAENDSLLANETDVGNYYYYVIQTINNCQSEALEVLLNINPLPFANFTYLSDFLEVTFENLSEYADSNLWSFGDGSTSYEENPVHNYSYFDYYLVDLTVWNECGEDETFNIIIVNVSVDDVELIKIDIFPNPISDKIILENLIAVEKVNIRDIYGRKVIEIEKPDFNVEIDTKTLTKGTYIIHIIFENRTSRVYKVIK